MIEVSVRVCVDYIDARRLPRLGKEVESEVSGKPSGGMYAEVGRGSSAVSCEDQMFIFSSLCW